MHGCYPGIGAWFQEGLSGIRFDTAAPGFQHFIVKPSKVGDVTSVTARVPSMYGIIESNWTSKDSSFTLQAAIPGNTSATVYLPALGFGATNVIIQEGGIIIYDKGQQKGPVGGVSLKDTSANCIALDVGSGIYNFRVSHKNATGAINREAQTIMVNRVSLENGVLDIALNVRKAQRQIIHMSIFNCKGALVKSIAAKTGVEETQHISLDVSDLPKGVFCMSVESKGGRMIIRRFSIAKQI
jgi:alpha-L-rhamnosidase